MAQLAIFLFGPPRIELNGLPVKISRHKAIALLAYLCINPTPHSRNILATLLWPDQDQSRARAALRRILVTLNKAGFGEWLAIDRETIGLKDGSDLWIDVDQFHHLIATCLTAQKDTDTVCITLLTEAVKLYTADFMAGFTLKDSPDFDEWQRTQSEILRRDLTSALARLIRCYGNRNDFEPAIAHAQRWVSIDPLYELAQRQLMQLYAWNNQRNAALSQYLECARILNQELGIEPSEETTVLYTHIQQGNESKININSERKLTLPLRIETPLHNFPAQPTPFIGRQRTLAEITKLLKSPDCKLLTLTGPGGIGKTRLAIQAAIEQSSQFTDGLYFVPLASVSSSDFAAWTLAESLGLSLDGQTNPHAQILNHLRSRHMLLVLDNFEHLTKETDLLLDILTTAPNIKLLITSRERLNLQGEWTFEVKGLSYPTDSPYPLDSRYPLDNLDSQSSYIERYSAVTLFLQRAHRVNSNFELTAAEKPHIVRICQLVEGIPLGIELAATWVRVLSCQEIAQEIERMYTKHNLDFLATSLQDVPKRHQSLRLAFEHSWQLLSTEEQCVFRQLSVFRGGCTKEAIVAVTGATLFSISTLVDKSLLGRNTPQRYEMHEILRQYALEKLHQVPSEDESVQNNHCAYYARFLQTREKRLRGEQQKEILAEIAGDIENIRKCWQWAITHTKVEQLEKATETLWYFYAMYSWFQEGAEAFGQAVTRLQQANTNDKRPSTLLGQHLTHHGWFLLRQGFYEKANQQLQTAVAIFEQLNDQIAIADPLHHLGILAGEVGNYEEAIQLLEQSLTIYKSVDNPWGTAWTLSSLAYRLSELDDGYNVKAQQLLRQSLTIYKTVGNKQGVAVALNNSGYIAYRQHNYNTSKELLQESLVLRREAGFPRGIAVTLNNLGHVTGALGDYPTCKTYYREGLKIAANIQAVPLILAALGGVALPLANEGKPEQALELLLFALHHPASNKETRDRAIECLSDLRPKLPSEIFSAIQIQVKEQPRQLKDIITEILAQNQNSQK